MSIFNAPKRWMVGGGEGDVCLDVFYVVFKVCVTLQIEGFLR